MAGESNGDPAPQLSHLSDEEVRQLYRRLTGVRPGSDSPSGGTENEEVEICGVSVRTDDLLELGRQVALLEAYTRMGVPFDQAAVADALSFVLQVAEAGLTTRTSVGHPTRPLEYEQVLEEITAAIAAVSFPE